MTEEEKIESTAETPAGNNSAEAPAAENPAENAAPAEAAPADDGGNFGEDDNFGGAAEASALAPDTLF